MKATIKNNILTIEIPMQEAKPSASGKTLVHATTSGNKVSEVLVGGKPLIVGLNAYTKLAA